MKDKFEEVKVRMIMKLKKLSRAEAEAEARSVSANITRENDGDDLLSAAEFFGED